MTAIAGSLAYPALAHAMSPTIPNPYLNWGVKMWQSANESPLTVHSLKLADNNQHWSWIGLGYSCAHYGELLQGEFSVEPGRRVRGLVSLPYRKAGTICHVRMRLGRGEIQVPDRKEKTRQVVKNYLKEYGLGFSFDVSVEIHSLIPTGIGMGSSTADLVATIRALDAAIGKHTVPSTMARMAVAAESASDSIMLSNDAVLFAQREGSIIETFQGALPSMALVGMNLQPGATYSTTDNPPAVYDDNHIRTFDELRLMMRDAIARGSVKSLGLVATESALINQEFVPKNHLAEIIRMAKKLGGVGVSVAHSGTVGAILFPSKEDVSECALLSVHALAQEYGFGEPDLFYI